MPQVHDSIYVMIDLSHKLFVLEIEIYFLKFINLLFYLFFITVIHYMIPELTTPSMSLSWFNSLKYQ